jgi:hypothetical protein
MDDWICPYGVRNCPICPRPGVEYNQREKITQEFHERKERAMGLIRTVKTAMEREKRKQERESTGLAQGMNGLIEQAQREQAQAIVGKRDVYAESRASVYEQEQAERERRRVVVEQQTVETERRRIVEQQRVERERRQIVEEQRVETERRRVVEQQRIERERMRVVEQRKLESEQRQRDWDNEQAEMARSQRKWEDEQRARDAKIAADREEKYRRYVYWNTRDTSPFLQVKEYLSCTFANVKIAPENKNSAIEMNANGAMLHRGHAMLRKRKGTWF